MDERADVLDAGSHPIDGPAAPPVVIVTDLAGMVGHWGAGAEELFGVSQAQAVGRSIEGLVLPPTWSARPVLVLLASGSSWSGAFTAPRPDAAAVRVEVTGRAVSQDDRTVELVWDVRTVAQVDPDVALLRRLSSIVESSADAITGLDATGGSRAGTPPAS